MADEDYAVIRITPKERTKIQTLAQKRGYGTTDAYLRALIESDAKAHNESPPFEDEQADLVASFRRSMNDAIEGKTFPISTLWDDINDE
jgi:hypothetical protein